MKNKGFAQNILNELYGNESIDAMSKIDDLLAKYGHIKAHKKELSQKDCIVITYADSIISDQLSGLKCLKQIFDKYIGKSVSAIHLLPFFDYSSDDGFSVIDYRSVHKDAGSWQEINQLSEHYDLMFDAVINHISRHSSWFKGYLTGEHGYKNYFIECDPSLDYSSVTRPRALPLLTAVETSQGQKYVWTTFSDDQIDLNFANLDTLIDILDILLFYVSNGAKYIRLDAIGFLWKRIGTTCMNLYETHQCIRLMRWVIEQVDDSIVIITETNIPHEENISYFGINNDEAHMVYQFPLPPLVVFSFLSSDITKLTNWYSGLDMPVGNATFFNFLASHDGIGLRPCEGILSEDEMGVMERATVERGGKISYRNLPDGGKKPYELNISLLSLLCGDMESIEKKVKKFLASQGVLLSVIGVPGIYIHSLLGSENDIEGMETSGINRRINREKLNMTNLVDTLDDEQSLRHLILEGYKELLSIRKSHSAFSPRARQVVDDIDRRVFAITRISDDETIKVRINVSEDYLVIPDTGVNLFNGKIIEVAYEMEPYEIMYIR